MPRDSAYDQARAVLDSAAAQLGVPAHDARLLRLHSNASFALPSAGLVIRIATNLAALDRVTTSIAVTRWLADRGFPCVIPADIAAQPLVTAGHAVSAWRYVPTTDAPAPTGAEVGRLLRDLHAQADPSCPLSPLDDPLASVASAVDEAPDAMPQASRSWLSDRIDSLRSQWSGMDFALPAGLIHGDAHTGNLMRITSGEIILGDWDHAATGPREWDLIQIHYMHRRFGRASQNDLDAFSASYGWDISSWPGLETLRRHPRYHRSQPLHPHRQGQTLLRPAARLPCAHPPGRRQDGPMGITARGVSSRSIVPFIKGKFAKRQKDLPTKA